MLLIAVAARAEAVRSKVFSHLLAPMNIKHVTPPQEREVQNQGSLLKLEDLPDALPLCCINPIDSC